VRVARHIAAGGGNGASLKAGPDPWVHAFRGLAIFSCALPRLEAEIGVHNVSVCHASMENSVDMEKILEHRENMVQNLPSFYEKNRSKAAKQISCSS